MTARPHILLDFLAFDPTDGGFTAACRALVEICREVQGLDFTVLTSQANALEFRESGFPILSHAFPRSLRYGINSLITPAVVRGDRFSAVHYEMSAASPLVRIPTSMTLHDLAFVGNRKAHNTSLGGKMMHWYWNSYYLGALQRVSRIKCISHTTADDLQAYNSRRQGVEVIYPFFRSQNPSVERGFCAGGVLKIVFVGTILPRKNLAFLLDAASRLSRPWKLHLIGNIAWGSDVLRSHAERENIVVHGFVSDSERDEIVAEADLMILPSLAEGFGYPPLEAAALGTPSLLSDIPVFREIAPAPALFGLSDAGALADRLENLNAGELAALAVAWRGALQAFSFERAVSANTAYFEELAEAKHDK